MDKLDNFDLTIEVTCSNVNYMESVKSKGLNLVLSCQFVAGGSMNPMVVVFSACNVCMSIVAYPHALVDTGCCLDVVYSALTPPRPVESSVAFDVTPIDICRPPHELLIVALIVFGKFGVATAVDGFWCPLTEWHSRCPVV
jgi:hypothetical protein